MIVRIHDRHVQQRCRGAWHKRLYNDYSARNASTGLTRLARRTGKRHARSAARARIDNKIIDDGDVNSMTKRLSELYAKRTSTEGVKVA